MLALPCMSHPCSSAKYFSLVTTAAVQAQQGPLQVLAVEAMHKSRLLPADALVSDENSSISILFPG